MGAPVAEFTQTTLVLANDSVLPAPQAPSTLPLAGCWKRSPLTCCLYIVVGFLPATNLLQWIGAVLPLQTLDLPTSIVYSWTVFVVHLLLVPLVSTTVHICILTTEWVFLVWGINLVFPEETSAAVYIVCVVWFVLLLFSISAFCADMEKRFVYATDNLQTVLDMEDETQWEEEWEKDEEGYSDEGLHRSEDKYKTSQSPRSERWPFLMRPSSMAGFVKTFSQQLQHYRWIGRRLVMAMHRFWILTTRRMSTASNRREYRSHPLHKYQDARRFTDRLAVCISVGATRLIDPYTARTRYLWRHAPPLREMLRDTSSGGWRVPRSRSCCRPVFRDNCVYFCNPERGLYILDLMTQTYACFRKIFSSVNHWIDFTEDHTFYPWPCSDGTGGDGKTPVLVLAQYIPERTAVELVDMNSMCSIGVSLVPDEIDFKNALECDSGNSLLLIGDHGLYRLRRFTDRDPLDKRDGAGWWNWRKHWPSTKFEISRIYKFPRPMSKASDRVQYVESATAFATPFALWCQVSSGKDQLPTTFRICELPKQQNDRRQSTLSIREWRHRAPDLHSITTSEHKALDQLAVRWWNASVQIVTEESLCYRITSRKGNKTTFSTYMASKHGNCDRQRWSSQETSTDGWPWVLDKISWPSFRLDLVERGDTVAVGSIACGPDVIAYMYRFLLALHFHSLEGSTAGNLETNGQGSSRQGSSVEIAQLFHQFPAVIVELICRYTFREFEVLSRTCSLLNS